MSRRNRQRPAGCGSCIYTWPIVFRYVLQLGMCCLLCTLSDLRGVLGCHLHRMLSQFVPCWFVDRLIGCCLLHSVFVFASCCKRDCFPGWFLDLAETEGVERSDRSDPPGTLNLETDPVYA